ncbi:hypothetical protein MBAV_002412 [Candidatus Magnetobacterium bavaricum]|uniref:Uncharacterized protein n=1 Tax=Candidatus Magnetobacterium bavaricum TaxID=29290 RepID=A0A0F3GU77_9BACT|nr:hypothetical protein MBAV_002412 [Candidatus Magnetobacterium bavaricum]
MRKSIVTMNKEDTNYPTTRLLTESLKTTPNLRKICVFAKIQEIPSEKRLF